MARRFYLDNIGARTVQSEIQLEDSESYTSKYKDRWSVERDKYGFDSGDTWNLGITMMSLLYERLMMYRDVTIVDTSFYKLTIFGVERSLGEWIDIMISNMEECLSQDRYECILFEEYDKAESEEDSEWYLRKMYEHDFYMVNTAREVWEIWSVVFMHVWW